jgi:type III restriction enzyme
LNNAINEFSIDYKKVKSTVHPTKLTDANGSIKNEVDASDVGVFYSDEKVADNYLFDKLFYDSELEKENIKTKITEVVVFTKIPKNSIKIPIAGGKSYSPDFAYVINFKDGNKKLYFVLETKNTDEIGLRKEETQKIKHAEKFFGNNIEIKFKTQLNKNKIIDLIQEIYFL